MILRNIRNFLQKEHEATISQIAKSLGYEQDFVKSILLDLIRRKMVKIKQENSQNQCSACSSHACNSCSTISVKEAVIYQWVAE